jgi:hypothetical protein
MPRASIAATSPAAYFPSAPFDPKANPMTRTQQQVIIAAIRKAELAAYRNGK